VGAAAGLTDDKPLSIKVLVLGEGAGATKLKLMSVAGTTPRGGDNEFIHSHTGFRYLTIMVTDTTAALERLAKLGVKPIAKSPVLLPESLVPGKMYLTVVRDPDGNLVELIGPKK
jgi:catechol 2,3-dioxygenase-like lactoylglutathione lyase family enzyme